MPDEAARTGLAVLDMARAERFAEIAGMFLPQLRAMVSAGAVEAAWNAVVSELGALSSAGTPVTEESAAGATVVKIPLTFEHGARTLVVSVSASGGLSGVQVASAEAARPVSPWLPPTYADPGAFDEHDVVVGDGPLTVPGTMSVPHGAGPFAGIVLLSGSGPNDRDGTVGRNKPLKDVAWGLASRGIAVLRFDKVTLAHPAEVMKLGDITLSAEYGQAAAAVQLLRQHAGVDGEHVFLLGHSLGGTVAPRIAAGDTSIAGLVLFAGGAAPLQWVLVRQMRYLASLDPASAPAAEPALAAMTERAKAVDNPDLSPATPSDQLPFGLPASYWLDLRAYRPAQVAASLGRPILLLQGGRDYQATVADDLAIWQAGLAGTPDVTMRIYPEDNHFFFVGSGKSSPAELEAVQHVDPAVVSDIAGWLLATSRAERPTRSESRDPSRRQT